MRLRRILTAIAVSALAIGSVGQTQSPPAKDQSAASTTADELSLSLAAANGDTKALEKLRNLANNGNAEAQFWFGSIHEEGKGVRKDAREAVRWYRKAADQGNSDAQGALGEMYQKGEGVPRKDAVQAVQWYRRSADQGNAVAQELLGLMYQNGEGVPRDLVTAYMWLNLAAARNNMQKAKTERDALEPRMTPEQLAQAQRLSRDWKPAK